MKKIKLVAAAALLFFATSAYSQSFEEGTNVISVGYGFGNLTKTLIKAVAAADNSIKITAVGPVFAKFEHGLSDKIGIGVNVAYIGVKANSDYQGFDANNYTETIKYNSLSILGRVNYHFANSDKVDPYIGVGAGYKTGGWSFKSTEPTYTAPTDLKGGGLGFETTIGLRVYPIENFGLYSEFGLAKGLLQVGAVYKL